MLPPPPIGSKGQNVEESKNILSIAIMQLNDYKNGIMYNLKLGMFI